MSRAAKVGPRASIVDIRLVDHSAKLREITSDSPTLMRTGRGAKFIRETDAAEVRVFVTFETDVAFDTPESKKNPPVSVTATYAILYKVADLTDIVDEDLEAFANVNGQFNAWPFWRELFHAAIGRMGMQPSTLPTLRVQPDGNVDESEA